MNRSPNTAQVLETLKFVRKFSGQTILVKLGGAALENTSLVADLCEDLALIRSAGVSLVLVHGGGASINQELERRNITWDFHDGQRVTTPEMMEVIEMVLCGKVNKKVVRTINSTGISAAGLAGTDNQTLSCQKTEPRLGQVGTIHKIDSSLIDNHLQSQRETGKGTIPVIAPVGVDEKGHAVNINADWAASRLAQALGIKKVFFMTDQDGILDPEGKVISEIDTHGLEALCNDGVVKGGMLAKTRAILDALRNGVKQVHIVNGSKPHSLIEEFYTDMGIGTVCKLGAPK